MKIYLLAVLIEIIGIAIVGTGIGMEIVYGGEIHFITITIGSCLIAIGGVIFGKFVKLRK